jgi:hypothetical protein
MLEENYHDDEHFSYDIIPTKTYHQLPAMLREPALHFADTEERDLFLIGALGIVSGMLPNVQGHYFGSALGTNLYCFIAGAYGTGKGTLKWAQMLGMPVHRHRVQQSAEMRINYCKDMSVYRRQAALYTKGKLQEPPQEPASPAHLKLFIPANTTKTAVVQLLKENGGSGIIFETEGDTLADMLRQDYGNFSDILRKAFHHEGISYFRRADNEDVEVPHPALSVVLSGTFDQLLRLVPSPDNGLFSRICFFIVQGSDEFKNPFSDADIDIADYFEKLGNRYLQLYQHLSARTTPVTFCMEPRMQQTFVKYMSIMKNNTQEEVNEDLNGTVNRMGVICYRIAMLLAVLRQYEKGLLTDTLHCHNEDLGAAMVITARLMWYSRKVYDYLQQYGRKRAVNALGHTEITDAQRLLCYNLHRTGLSLRKIAIEVFDTERAHMKVKRILRDYGIDKAA